MRVSPEPETLQPEAAAGKPYEATPDWPSLEAAVTANWPLAAPGR